MNDPAFLFYYRDFKSSTENLTLEQKGAYITLMCLQAENGHITEKDMLKICSNICYNTMTVSVNENLVNWLKTKFIEDPLRPGCFINKRLASEIQKRRSYSESRRKNRSSKKIETYDSTYDNTYEKHMVNANENRNRNINENIEKGGVGEKTNSKAEAEVISIPCTPTHQIDTDGTFITAQEFLQNDQIWMEMLCRNVRITPEECMKRLERFSLKMEGEGKYYNPLTDRSRARAQFQKWCLTWSDNEKTHTATKTPPKKNAAARQLERMMNGENIFAQ
jgi:uncharacterized protein YdaU (DUF1376 family)